MSTRIKAKYVAIGSAVLGAIVTLGSTALSSGGESAATAPDWFAPIAASYGNNPRITPGFDFASLYSAGHPAWFAEIAEYYGHNPLVTPDFDFAGLYGSATG
jgi:hypothetical protein